MKIDIIDPANHRSKINVYCIDITFKYFEDKFD